MSYRVPGHVHFHELHGEVVLLNAKTDAYLGLNRSAAVIWQALARGDEPANAVTALLERFDVTPEAAQADVEALINDLVKRGLLEQGNV